MMNGTPSSSLGLLQPKVLASPEKKKKKTKLFFFYPCKVMQRKLIFSGKGNMLVSMNKKKKLTDQTQVSQWKPDAGSGSWQAIPLGGTGSCLCWCAQTSKAWPEGWLEGWLGCRGQPAPPPSSSSSLPWLPCQWVAFPRQLKKVIINCKKTCRNNTLEVGIQSNKIVIRETKL